jgi:hypothetical protein
VICEEGPIRKDFDRRWQELSAEVLTGMKEWRLQHPRARIARGPGRRMVTSLARIAGKSLAFRHS